MKTIRVNDNERRPVSVHGEDIVRVVNRDKTVFVSFIYPGDCQECCFGIGGPGLEPLGVNSCRGMSSSCIGGCFKLMDEILESL